MKLDLHVHAALSKKIGFELPFVREMIAGAKANDLDAIALTEHHNTGNFDEIFPILDRTFDYVGPYYEAGGVRILPGVEVGTAEGPHLVTIGDRMAIRTFHARLQAATGDGANPTLASYFDYQTGLELLCIVAHPLRPQRELDLIDAALFPRFDALELNARDLYVLGDEIEAKTLALGQAHEMPVFAGSDSHQHHQLGSVTNSMESDDLSIAHLKVQIRAGAFTRHIHPQLRTKVTVARQTKDWIKSQRLAES